MNFIPISSITNSKQIEIWANMKAIFARTIQKMLFLLCFILLSNFAYANTQTINIKDFTERSVQNIPISSEEFSKQYLSPLISDDVSLKTPNGTEFSASMMCQSSNAFLEIFAQPGTTGDLAFIQFKRDTNLDGSFNEVKTFTQSVSGICANGLISCTAGTWDDCLGYKWNAKNNDLSLVATGIGNLGGCYCINSSCGDASLSTRILGTIIKDLGSAAAQILANNNPEYTISDAKVTPVSAKFYGQKLSGCGNGNITNLASYRSNPQNIENEANNLKADSDGIYQLMANSSLATDNLSTLRSCEVTRHTAHENVRLEDIISFNGGTGGIHRCATDGCLELVLGRVGNNYWGGWCSIYNQKVSFYIDMPERINRAVLVRAKYDDWIRVAANNNTIWAHPYSDWDGKSINGRRCEWSTSWNKAPNVDFTSLLKQKGRVDFEVNVQVANKGEGYAYAQVFVDESCKLSDEYISNGCETIQQDTNCQLKNEWVDTVQTYENFHPTGKSLIATTRDIGSCGLELTRNWWKIKREYKCQSSKNFDFSKGLDRKNTIKTTLINNQYDDLINGSTTTRDINTPDIQTNNCTNACKVRRVKEGSTVTSDGVKDNTGNEFETLYRKCTGDTQNICPNKAEETIINNCSCLNEFGEVSSMMNAMRYAAQDLLCTTGNPQGF